MIDEEIIARRRELRRIVGYKTLADVGFDGPWVTPYQKASHSPDGPVLLAKDWLDARSADYHREVLTRYGYLPDMTFNKVIDLALSLSHMDRAQLYVTQVFHLLPLDSRSAHIPERFIDKSFTAVTIHELKGRRVIALGSDARDACCRNGFEHFVEAPHPSARGMSHLCKAKMIAASLMAVRQSLA